MLTTVLRRWSWCNSYFVWLCGFYYQGFHPESCLAPCYILFPVLISIVIISLGKEGYGLCAFRALPIYLSLCHSMEARHEIGSCRPNSSKSVIDEGLPIPAHVSETWPNNYTKFETFQRCMIFFFFFFFFFCRRDDPSLCRSAQASTRDVQK